VPLWPEPQGHHHASTSNQASAAPAQQVYLAREQGGQTGLFMGYRIRVRAPRWGHRIGVCDVGPATPLSPLPTSAEISGATGSQAHVRVSSDIDEVPKHIVSLREALKESARHVSRHLLRVWAQAVAGSGVEVVVEIEADRRL